MEVNHNDVGQAGEHEREAREIVVVDVETTGLDPMVHECIELGAIRLDARTFCEIGRFERRIKMFNSAVATTEALRVNGYSPELWADAVSVVDAFMDFAEFSSGAVFCAHNVTFDWGFVERGFCKAGVVSRMDYHRLDIPSIAWGAGLRESASAKKICASLGIPEEPKPHRAINGAERAAECLRRLRQRDQEHARPTSWDAYMKKYGAEEYALDDAANLRHLLSELLQAAKDVCSTSSASDYDDGNIVDADKLATLRSVVERARKVVGE